MDHKHMSLADHIFERLENDILCGKYQKGELLTETKLSSELGVSRTPIREALHRLAAEHLIEDTPKGSRVSGMTAEGVREILFIRTRLEGEWAARAAERITDEELSQLREVLDLQEFYFSKGDPEHIRSMDSRFHELFYKFSGSSEFLETLLQLHKKIQKYRRVSVRDTSRAEKSVIEHRKIFDAIAAHDADAARLYTEEHVRNAMKSIIKSDKPDLA